MNDLKKKLIERLGITAIQAEIALYSGRIPKTIDPELFIQNWERQIKNAKTDQNNEFISTGCLTFPVHQR